VRYPRFCLNLFRHRVKERLEKLRIVVRHGEADELTAAGIDLADDVLADVSAVIGLGRARAAPHQVLAGARIALEAALVAEEGFLGGSFQGLRSSAAKSSR
jgi:hypothetical protein